MSAGDWLTVEDVARHLFGQSTIATNARVRRAIRAKVIPARRIGRRWHVHRTVLDQLASGGDDPSVMAHPNTRAVGA